jgi:hypothetical protein
MESLDYVVQILSSNQLFMPNLNVNKDAMDSDVKNWLNAMITNKTEESQAPVIDITTAITPGNGLMEVVSKSVTQ